MRHRVSHGLSEEAAKQVVQKAIDKYAERFARYKVQGRWTDERTVVVGFAARGKHLEGTVRLEPSAIVFEMDVPLLLRPFTGRATAKIDEHVARWVREAKSGDS